MTSFEHNKKDSKFICKPNSKEILLSLASVPNWCRILAQESSEAYKPVLLRLLEQDFYNSDDRLVIGKIAKDLKLDNSKLHKILNQIYEAILLLNEERPQLFGNSGSLHELSFKYFDSYCYLNMWLTVTPRIYETVTFEFVNAKVGTTSFTVTKVSHKLQESNTITTVKLEGGNINPYRQWLINRGLFEGKIGLYDIWNQHEHLLDDELKKIYK